MDDGILTIDLVTPFIGYEAVDVWYLGEYTDHIYPTCPTLARSRQPLRRGQDRLYPEAGDVCGTCLRWWRARKAKGSAHADRDA